MRSITAFDHTLILVEDLDDGDARMRRLGFRPTPRGVHSAHMGTANSTIMLPDMTYFEVIGVLNPTPSNEGMRRMLEQRQGLLGYAMKTDDAHASLRELAAVSAADGEVVEFSRPVDLPGGTRDAAFSIANFNPQKSFGLKMFACTHHTPDVVWREDYLDQPNGVTGLCELFGEVADVDEAEADLKKLFAERVSRDGDAIVIDYGNVQVTFLSAGELENRFALKSVGGTALHVLRLKTRDAGLTCSVLEENHVEFKDRGNNVWSVAPHEACGTMIQFVSR